MKKIVFASLIMSLVMFSASAQTKKDISAPSSVEDVPKPEKQQLDKKEKLSNRKNKTKAVSAIAPAKQMKNIYSFKVKDIDGNEFDFATLKGKKIIIVNTASKCGFTPQYKDLETLYQQYKDKNLVIIGFPANNFGQQEPGTDSEIHTFCQKNYGVTFPMMEKISVKGSDEHELYKWLTDKKQNGVSDGEVKWNFGKFLIDENGKWFKCLPSKVEPMDEQITNWIEGK